MAKKCNPCEVAAAVGLSFDVCDRALKGNFNCRSLENKFIRGEIRKATVFKTLHSAARSAGKHDAAKQIKSAAKRVGVKV